MSLNSHLTQESVQEVCYIIGSMYHIILNMRIVLLRNAFCNIWFLLFPNKFQFVFFIVILFCCIICSLGLVLFEQEYRKIIFCSSQISWASPSLLAKMHWAIYLFVAIWTILCFRDYICLYFEHSEIMDLINNSIRWFALWWKGAILC